LLVKTALPHDMQRCVTSQDLTVTIPYETSHHVTLHQLDDTRPHKTSPWRYLTKPRPTSPPRYSKHCTWTNLFV